jgi:hypothetical protein
MHQCPHCDGVCRCHEDDALEVNGTRPDCEHCEPSQPFDDDEEDLLREIERLEQDDPEGYTEPDYDEGDFDDVDDPEDDDPLYA